jgi:hypothetical protein
LSGLGIVLVGSKLKAKPKEKTEANRTISKARKCLFQDEAIFIRLRRDYTG